MGDPAALVVFLDAHGFPAPGDHHEVDHEDLEQVYALRRRVWEILLGASADEVVRGGNALVAGAGCGPRLARDRPDGSWEWHVTVRTGARVADGLAVQVGVGLLGALRTLGHERFRGCAAPGCAGLFVDTSRAGRRRYCTPDVCGNRLNVARHRARRRGAAGPGEDAPPERGASRGDGVAGARPEDDGDGAPDHLR